MKDIMLSLIENGLPRTIEKSDLVLRSVIESFQDVVIFALDCQYRYFAFNSNHYHTMKRIWGVEIAIGKSMLDYIENHEDRIKAKKNFDRALSGESFTLEEEYGNIEIERRYYEDKYNPIFDKTNRIVGLTLLLTDITERKKLEQEREDLIKKLEESLREIKTLSGMLPICASCKKIRDDKGYWNSVEDYIRQHSDANFTHGICPECYEKELKKIRGENIAVQDKPELKCRV